MKEKFLALDAMRGLAALLVTIRHTGFFWAGVQPYHSYLAVDLFFIISGFVIGYAYEAKLIEGSLTGKRFVVVRLIRLYPLYFLSSVFCFCVVLAKIKLGRTPVSETASDLATILLSTLLFLPSNPIPDASLFPLNGPFWSLFYELIINSIYGFTVKYLQRRALTTCLVILGNLMIAVSIVHGNLDTGGSWGQIECLAGMVRSAFGFLLGLYVYRTHAVRIERVSSPIVTWATIMVGIAMLLVPGCGAGDAVVDLLAVFVVFPLCVLRAADFRQAGAVGARNCVTLGAVSYPIYVLHVPFGNLIAWSSHKWIVGYAPLSGFLFIVILTFASVIILRLYDTPLRQFLSSLLRTARRA